AGNNVRVVPAPRASETHVSPPIVEQPQASVPTTDVDAAAAPGGDASTRETIDGPEMSLPRTTPAAPLPRAEASAPVSAADGHDDAPGAFGLTDEQRIVAALKRFTDAYARLNPVAAKAVWPGVDTRALARAFDALESQSIEFDGCTLHVTDSQA